MLKTLVFTFAAVLGLYGFFLVLSYAGRPESDFDIETDSAFQVQLTTDEEPQYGGVLNVGTHAITVSALSWDPADWNWKANHDMGMYFEQLFSADLDMSLKKGGPYRFTMQAYIPADALRGEIAESWEFEDPLTLVVKVRRGIMFPDKPGIMQRRELTAEDVVFSYYRQRESPKIIPTFLDHIKRVWARDDHTVVFEFNYYNAEWDYRFGYGYYSCIIPRELSEVDVHDWRNAVGSGPFQIERYVEGNSQIYTRTDDYWDRETLGGKQYRIPFIDTLVYRIIKDEATYLTQLRTGKLDILEAVRWLAVDHLKESTPELRWSRWLGTAGTFIAMRVDQEPFDDVRVRRAMNLAVNQQEIVEQFYGGHAELFAYPLKPDFVGYYKPLEDMPESIQELYGYDPEKAKQLLAEAGYPDGFTFTTQINAGDASARDLAPLVADYLSRIGVTMKIEPMEYASYLSTMTSNNNKAGYFARSGHVNPTTAVRAGFLTGQTWNISEYSVPEIDAKILKMLETRDETERIRMVQELTAHILDEAPYIWLPIEYVYTAWWPWVKNYNGEIRAGAQRPGPIYARLWIDQEMKRRMGFARENRDGAL